MTVYQFEGARQRGTAGKIGQLNPLQRYGVAEEVRNGVFLCDCVFILLILSF
jgi:hypothetical protein